jgi:hypothetical protein
MNVQGAGSLMVCCPILDWSMFRPSAFAEGSGLEPERHLEKGQLRPHGCSE